MHILLHWNCKAARLKPLAAFSPTGLACWSEVYILSYMSQRKVAFAEKEFYHLYNRGNSKQKIFHDIKDYDRFIKLLFLSNGTQNFKFDYIDENNIFKFDRGMPLVSIGAYCLMPNHFHLLVTQTQNGSISKFMQKLTTGYSMYYNKKYARTGVLFEGKFKSEHAGDDRYLKYLFSYIHLNPLKLIDRECRTKGIKDIAQAATFLKEYKYSSYVNYTDPENTENMIITKTAFPEYFPNKETFEKEILEWLSYGDRQDL